MTTPITCLQCSGPLGPSDRFCAQCGAELLWCASCGEFLLQNEETCPKCGTPGIPRPDSRSIPYDLTEDDSPWAEVVARLRRATLGEFEIGHELGRGGMAAVFLAHELSLHRDVAIKVMSPGLLMGDGMIDRFRREAITIAHLNHPNIVSVYSVRAAEGLHFFVMRCIQGRSLEHVIKDGGKLPIPMVRSILYHVGSALAYAHRFKVVHRDIKPANILIDEEGNAVVTDFGIAKAAEGPSHTHTGFMVGTPAYMSPEQCAGGEVSGASDQYSLGAVAYEMVTGSPPFTGSTYSVIQAHVEQAPRPLSEHVECPPELEAAILRMLAKNPEERWPNMTQALAALGAVALPDDDPLRGELSRLSMAGARTSFAALGTGIRGAGSKTSAVLQATPPGMMRAVSILPPPPGLEVGDSFLLVARVHDGQAARLPTGPVQWSSDAPGVLRVNATKAVATAVTPGSALIRATCDGHEGRLRVTVASPRADSIVVKAVEKPINVGDEVRLEASPRDKRGRAVTRPVTWRSEDDSVATISLDGVLVAHSAGSTQITAELDEARASVSITVQPPRVAAVHISPAPESVVAGDSFALTATPLDRWAGPLNDRTVAWSVNDVNIAVITAGGWVMTRNPGLVMLTAVCEGISSSLSVTVQERPAEPIITRPRPEPAAWELPPEPRIPEPRRARRRPGWLVAAGAAFLVAGGFWLVGGRRQELGTMPGTAVALRDQTPADDGALESAGYAAAANATPVSSVASDSSTPVSLIITQRPARPVAVGSSTNLVAESRAASGKLLGPEAISWVSTDTTVVSVDSSTGALRALTPGRAQVIAVAGAQRDTAGIVVRSTARESAASPPQIGSLSIASRDSLGVGDTATLALTALDTRGKPVRGVDVSWSSSEPLVASIDPSSGRVRAHAPGSTLIIARGGGESAISSLVVRAAAVASVDIAGGRPLKVGDTLELRAEPRDRLGHALSDRELVWAGSDPDIVTVDSSSGRVIARGAGTADVTAAAEGKSGKVRLTVLPKPRTSRTPELVGEAESGRGGEPGSADPAAERLRLVDQLRAAVDQCYDALARKDVVRVEQMYKPESKSDRENLKKLGRILRTSEWGAQVGEREEGAQRFGTATATMDFAFRLAWKDAFGGRHTSQPVFRAELTKNGDTYNLSSCRIIGSPAL